MQLSASQSALLEQPLGQRLFLSGPAGSGKTTAAAAYLRRLLESGIPGENILLLTPQRTLSGPYQELLHDSGLAAGSPPALLTIGGLARRMVELFWPLVSAAAGFGAPGLRHSHSSHNRWPK